MQPRLILILLSLLACPASATLSIDMYLSDANTPLLLRDPNTPHSYPDIMVGTRLCVIVSSDSRTGVDGSLSMSGADLEKAELVAGVCRGADQNCVGPVLPAAGLKASVDMFYDDDANELSFDFCAGVKGIMPGPWFIWDYRATGVGSCSIRMTENSGGSEEEGPDGQTSITTTVVLNHVASRDFNTDSVVNFKDFALLAQRWRIAPDLDPNGLNLAVDLDGNGHVTMPDLRRFNQFWLGRTDVLVQLPPVTDPNTPSSPVQL